MKITIGLLVISRSAVTSGESEDTEKSRYIPQFKPAEANERSKTSSVKTSEEIILNPGVGHHPHSRKNPIVHSSLIKRMNVCKVGLIDNEI